MSKNTKIQWCDSTENPAEGCGSRCELWPTIAQLRAALAAGIEQAGLCTTAIANRFEGMLPSDVYHTRHQIAAELTGKISLAGGRRHEVAKSLADAIAREFRCYAGNLHLRYGKNDAKPDKGTNPGFAPKFELITKFPGRMAKAAGWSDLAGTRRETKPWLDFLPRLIFVSDMADALSPEIDFEYLRQEIVEVADSHDGRKHIWLWLTKQPRRMAAFSQWLEKQGCKWPNNLMAMTSVTSVKTMGRINWLRRVRCELRGLSIEPLWSALGLDLTGIEWAIIGGESAQRRADAKPFEVAWVRDIRRQCRRAGVAFFLKQLGSNPVENGRSLTLKDGHGGDWNEWPKELRIREMPGAFRGWHRVLGATAFRFYKSGNGAAQATGHR